jgi:hypothetical protein
MNLLSSSLVALLLVTSAPSLIACGAQPQPPSASPETAAPSVAEPVEMADLVIPPNVDATLTHDGRRAIQIVGKAAAFGGAAVGYSGTPVREVAALRTLLAEPNASDALSVVIDQGSLPGQLLALSGLYSADHDRFLSRLDDYRGRTEQVRVRRDGCSVDYEATAVGELVETRAPNAVKLTGPGDTLKAWLDRTPGPSSRVVTLDIVGGGYPLTLRGQG